MVGRKIAAGMLALLTACAVQAGIAGQLRELGATTSPAPVAILPGAIGSFAFSPPSAPPLRVWYSAPAGDLTAVRVLVVMHGHGRNARSYRDAWIGEARRANALLIVPEFSEASYPGEAYALGSASFSVIEPLYDAVRAGTGNRNERYFLYGHSAGAQFVHRFLLLVPSNRVKRAVAANAGWYTAPEGKVAFPYGLVGSPTTSAGVTHFLATRLTVLLGENDTDPNDPELRHTAGAERQGPHRLARGWFFYQTGLRTSRLFALPFGWTLRTVPGVAHSNSGMVPPAAASLFTG